MIFIDESFAGIYVMGAVVGPRNEVEEAVRIVRSHIMNKNKNIKGKRKIELSEIKDSKIHRKYYEIKKMLLENLAICRMRRNQERDNVRIYAVYMRQENVRGLTEKEIYKRLSKELLQRIISKIEDDEIEITFDVYFDQYGEDMFRKQLYDEILGEYPDKQISLTHVPSETDKAIQVADIVTGTIRRHLTGEDRNGMDIIINRVALIEEIK